MQFKKVTKEIINSKKRYFVQNHTFYAKKRYFLQKVRNAMQMSVKVKEIDKGLNNLDIWCHVERHKFAKLYQKVGLKMCFSADLYHWKSNNSTFPIEIYWPGKKKMQKERFSSQIIRRSALQNMQLHKIPSPTFHVCLKYKVYIFHLL